MSAFLAIKFQILSFECGGEKIRQAILKHKNDTFVYDDVNLFSADICKHTTSVRDLSTE